MIMLVCGNSKQKWNKSVMKCYVLQILANKVYDNT